MPKKDEVWTFANDCKLLEEVQGFPILWDIQDSRYSRNDLKPQVWDDIAARLGHPITATSAKDRFANIKTTFQQNERRINNSKKSGAGTDDVYIPKWNLYNKCIFLRKSLAQAHSVSNISSQETSSLVEESGATNIPSLLTTQNSEWMYFDENLQQFQRIPEDIQQEVRPTSRSTSPSLSIASSATSEMNPPLFSTPQLSNLARCSTSTPLVASRNARSHGSSTSSSSPLYTNRGQKTRRSSDNSPMMQAAVKALSDLSKSDETPQDAIDAFGEYVVARLREMNESDRKRARRGIFNILETED